MKESEELRSLVRWLGIHGATAGINESKLWPIDRLRIVGAEMGLTFPEKTTRKALIDEIVRVANKRIEKSLGQLYEMSSSELIEYLNDIGAENDELLEVLASMDASPRKDSSRKSLVEFVARELSETGRFMRIAGTGSKAPESGES